MKAEKLRVQPLQRSSEYQSICKFIHGNLHVWTCVTKEGALKAPFASPDVSEDRKGAGYC